MRHISGAVAGLAHLSDIQFQDPFCNNTLSIAVRAWNAITLWLWPHGAGMSFSVFLKLPKNLLRTSLEILGCCDTDPFQHPSRFQGPLKVLEPSREPAKAHFPMLFPPGAWKITVISSFSAMTSSVYLSL